MSHSRLASRRRTRGKRLATQRWQAPSEVDDLHRLTIRFLSFHAAFLHKKSWHTAGMAVQEDVWKRQQQAEHEKRKLEEMKKEIEEERKQAELRAEAIASGHVTKPTQERLEFMYKGRVGEAAPAPVPAVEKAIGKKRFDLPVEEGHNLVAQAEERQEEMHSKNEAWNRLNADPLLVMKQRELQSKQYITNNPVRMGQLKDEVRREKDRKRSKKDAKREKKRESKRERHRRRYNSSSESRSRSRSPRRERRRGRSSRHRRDSRSRSRSRSRSPRRSERRYRDDRDRRHRRDSRDRRRHDDRDDRKRHRDEIVRDEAHAQDASKGYGLTYANDTAEDAAAIRRDKRSRWREEEAKRAAERDPEPEWRGGNNVGHRTGRLTAEEKAARLAAMSADATAHDNARISKLRKNVGELGNEMSFVEEAARGPDRHHSEAPSFIAKARSSVYR